MAVLTLVSFVLLPKYYNFFHVVLFPNTCVRTTCKMEGYEVATFCIFTPILYCQRDKVLLFHKAFLISFCHGMTKLTYTANCTKTQFKNNLSCDTQDQQKIVTINLATASMVMYFVLKSSNLCNLKASRHRLCIRYTPTMEQAE